MRDYVSLTMGTTLEDNALRFGDRPAYRMGDAVLTHADLLDRAKRLASALEKAGLRRQDRISILSMNSLAFGEVLAMGQWSGIIVATVNFRLAPPEIEGIVADSSPRVLFFEGQYAPVVAAMRDRLTTVEHYIALDGQVEWATSYEEFLESGDPRGSSFQAREEDICALVYTGGTTGQPKGCIMGQREMRAGAGTLATEVKAGPGDSILLVMPLFHVGAMNMGQSVHYRGGTVVLHKLFDADAFLHSVANDGVTILHLAPTLLQAVLDHPDAESTGWGSISTLVYSAAAMPVPLLERGMALLGGIFVNLYGSTEVMVSGLARELHKPYGTEREKKWLASVGHPFPNVLVRIVDDEGEDCAPGTAGEIVVKGVSMSRGYWNNDAATIETFRDGWCHTGDVGVIDEDGLIYLVDRKKDVIISGGENIYSREVEDAVLRHPAVSECAVIGAPDEKWGEAVCAVVVLKDNGKASADDIIEHTRTLIAGYKRPRHVLFVDGLPKLPTGKINKVAIRDLREKLMAEAGR
ncbi:AMP-dependent synthetase [Tardibacter chloracetimidivorans]|uniref:3-methylmercaptopropionyl-CoA ligase n=1 Tax=Tardibacter chloracetimidivorans TaxID=1921510 RepID=A0A1L3ZWD2_9SPHN|nr:AMP-binding protein [Tardibacter chloracetimidivorans]API59925.1 AMP-dependent synthetase [Tardibacter chloracetimidivorans]